ncbi:MAG: ATP-binding protein, partial [Armatimonadota bacterium]|nr:ATP-binding protein [Armatimonadota bacterium]
RADSGKTVALSPSLQSRRSMADTLTAAPFHPGPSFIGDEEEQQMRCLSLLLPHTRDTLQVATAWDPTEDLLASLSWGLGLALTLLLLVSAGGDWQLVGRALRPIDEIVTEAERLTADRLTPTALQPRALSDNEVGHLVVALNGMLARLHTALAAQRQFTADSSHELRTPLTILQGEIETALSRERTVEQYRHVLGSSLEETARMTRIVDSLGLLARGDAASAPNPSVPVRLSELTAVVAESLRPQTEQAGLTLILDLQPNVTVSGAADDLRRVISNLLDNAIRYTAPGGTITLTVECVSQECRLRVADTGRGISAEDLPRIFDRFYRADKARVNDGGSGLGLAIVQHIVTAHGGRIDVQSALGQGSAFTVSLPHD